MYTFIIILKLILVLLIVVVFASILLIIIPFKYEISAKTLTKDQFIILDVFCIFKLLRIRLSVVDNNLTLSFFITNNLIFTQYLQQGSNNRIRNTKRVYKHILKKHFSRMFLSCLLSYLKDIFIIIKPSRIKIHGTYSFQDPSITGILSGFILIANNVIPFTNISLQPSFDGEKININADISGQILLLTIILKTLKFILKREVRKSLFKKSKIAKAY